MDYRSRRIGAGYDDDRPTPTLATDPDIPDWVSKLTPSELAAELERAKAQHRAARNPATQRHRDSDLVMAHAQIILNRTRGTRAEHPIAQAQLADGRQPSLMDMGRVFAANRHGPDAHQWDDRRILASASTAHISEVISQTATSVVLSRAPELLTVPLKVCRPVSLPDYKPSAVGTLELDAAVDAPTTVLNEWQRIIPMASAGRLQIRIAPLRIRFSEILLVNDDVAAMEATILAAAIAASQNEARQLIHLLTGETELADGSPWFTEANTAANLAAGMAAMRSYPINGIASDATPRYWVVPAAEELAARAEVASMTNGNSVPVEVLPTAHLGEGDPSFLFASPTAWPAVARGTLRGSGGNSLRWTPGSPTEAESSRDAIVEALHSVGYEPIGRLGVVKIDDD